MNENRWTIWHKSIATIVLISPGILGIGAGAATAATPNSPTTVTTARSVAPSTSTPTSMQLAGTPVSPPTTPTSGESADPQSRIARLVQFIRSIPSLLAKVVDGAKKIYSWFLQNVWPTVRAIAGALAHFVSAWNIWDAFN